jgi:hypothetical protein
MSSGSDLCEGTYSVGKLPNGKIGLIEVGK